MQRAIYFLMILCFSCMFFSCNDKPYKFRFPPEEFFNTALLPLGQAIYDDDAKTVKDFIKNRGIDVNTIDSMGNESLLLYAVDVESKSVVKTLLELGADPNLKSPTKEYNRGKSGPFYIRDRYPLSNATYDPDLYFAKILLQYGAKPNLGYPLHMAILNSPQKTELKMFQLLLDHGANINIVDNNGETPLMQCLYCFRFDLANFFLDKGADITIPNNNGFIASDLIQRAIDRYTKEEDKKEFMKRIQSTIDRFKARGITFPLPPKNKPESKQNNEQQPDTDSTTNKPQAGKDDNTSATPPPPQNKRGWSTLMDDDDLIIG